MTLDVVLALIGGYLLGSVPFGLVLTKPFGFDLRAIGSGNIGATNVLRTGRKDLALATLLLDSGKGAIAVAIAWALTGDVVAMLVAGVAAVVGHNFPVWLGFKGGKGVATTLGVLLATAWPVGLAACATWAAVAAAFRYSSLAALVALAAAPVYAWLWATPAHTVAFAVLAVLAWVRHHENIRRLLKGEESRIGKKKAG
ncbi:MAG: glycerol-3-phosphate acyltransferase [Rhodospirillaceae bacterium BRH_c57]|nr:MAG: glycerol-3-phosphate acyltransferase [Rhodospirillaceae bacterium BRH_c57]